MKFIFFLLLLACLPFQARAQIEISGLHARETAKGMRAGAVFGSIINKGPAPDKLLSVETPVCSDPQLHEMSDNKGVMKMRQIKNLDIPADGKIELKPMGKHIMLIGLKEPLQAGKTFPLTLVFEKAGKVETTFEIKSMGLDHIGSHHHD